MHAIANIDILVTNNFVDNVEDAFANIIEDVCYASTFVRDIRENYVIEEIYRRL